MHPPLRLAPALLALLALSPGGAGTPTPGSGPPAPAVLAELEPGLELGQFPGPAGAQGDGKIWVVRIDPARFELRLVNASAGDSRPRTVHAWTTASGAAAGINAGMFQTDGLTAVGLMRSGAHQNNPRRNGRYKAVLAFEPVRAGVPAVAILDAGCDELDRAGSVYGTLIQSIRMISCERKNVWAADGKRWSTAAIAVDGAGRALFIHARSPWPVHDLVEALLALPLDVRRAMYVEGGPEAQLYVRGGGREFERLGAFQNRAERESTFAWEIPNAVVAVPRRRGP